MADRRLDGDWEMSAAGAPADVVIDNSCTVTDAADAESRRLARRARREHPAARVVLTGCYAQTRPTEAAGEPAVDHVIGLNRLDALVAAVTAPLPAVARVVVGDARRERTVSTFGARTFAGQTRAFLKVQEGCDLFCTFCIIPMARGASRSLPPREVLAEVAALAREGFEEVVLTGVHLGGYGQDLVPAVDLAWLVAALAEQGLVPRLRLSSIDPHEVTEPLVRLLARAPAACAPRASASVRRSPVASTAPRRRCWSRPRATPRAGRCAATRATTCAPAWTGPTRGAAGGSARASPSAARAR